MERREGDNSRELHRERKALRAAVFLSELKLRPPEKTAAANLREAN